MVGIVALRLLVGVVVVIIGFVPPALLGRWLDKRLGLKASENPFTFKWFSYLVTGYVAITIPVFAVWCMYAIGAEFIK